MKNNKRLFIEKYCKKYPALLTDTDVNRVEKELLEAIEKDGEWINVNDQLPDKFEEVLVCLKHGGYEIGQVIRADPFIIYWHPKRTLDQGFGDCPEATYWKSIKPPKP